MHKKGKEVNYKMNIHLIGFDLAKEFLSKKDIIVKVSTKPETQKHFSCSGSNDNFKTSSTISVEKIQNSNTIFNVLVKKPKVNNGRTCKVIILFKTKDKFNHEHKFAFACINYYNFIQMMPEDEDENVKINSESDTKSKCISDKTQKIPIYQYIKSKHRDFIDEKNGGKIVGHMKILFSLLRLGDDFANNSENKSNNYIDSNKHISINMLKFKNYHIGERESSEYSKQNKTCQIKKQYANLL